MTETLRQQDIDALLRGAAAAEAEPEAAVVPYDFVRPPRLPRERRMALEVMMGRCVAALQSALSARLRCVVEVSLHSLEQVSYAELALSLGTPCAAFAFGLGSEVPGSGVLDFGPELSFALLERAFGGSGASAPPARALTALEQKVIHGFGERALAVLAQGWREAIPGAPGIGPFQSTPDLLQALPPEEVVLVAGIEIKLGEARHLMTVSLPFAALRAHLDQAAAPRVTRVASDEGRERRARIEGRLREVRITIAARLPQVWMSARAIAALAPGQVLHATHAPEAPIEVQLNGSTRFHASLGQVRKQLALRIVTAVTGAPGHDRPEPIHKGRTQ